MLGGGGCKEELQLSVIQEEVIKERAREGVSHI